MSLDFEDYEARVHVNDRDMLSIDLDFEIPGVFHNGQTVYVIPAALIDHPESHHLKDSDRERDAFCDDCADETAPIERDDQ